MPEYMELLQVVIDKHGSFIVRENDNMHQKPLDERTAALRGIADKLHQLAEEIERNGPGH